MYQDILGKNWRNILKNINRCRAAPRWPKTNNCRCRAATAVVLLKISRAAAAPR